MQTRTTAVAAAFVFGLSFSAWSAQAPQDSVSGEEVFQRACAACHVDAARAAATETASGAAAGTRIVPFEMLRQMTPEVILSSLENGKMQPQGSALTPAERRAVAQFASGKSFAESVVPAMARANRCTDDTPVRDPGSMPGWNGWGNGLSNTRFQPKETGGLTAEDLPRLRLKWAFGYPGAQSAKAQPTIAGGRLFVASETGDVYALNPKTGCTYWTFKAQAGIRTAASVGPYRSASGRSGYAVYFGDSQANAYAVDADTGEQIWVRKVDDHRSAAITGAPAVHDGRVFVPVQGLAEEISAARDNYPCCTFRGSLVALDAHTGEVLWKTYTMPESRPRETVKPGVTMFGPAGGSIWSAPTVDPKRGLVYVGTGNGYADPPQPTTNAIIAMDLRTGAVRWVRQILEKDVWILGCNPGNPEGNPACPKELGPDLDFAAPPALASAAGRELLVVPQKSGVAFALDPDDGSIVWQYRYGRGSAMGGQWGGAVDGERAYFGVQDLQTDTPGGMRAVELATGREVWSKPPQPKLCEGKQPCFAGQGGPLTAIPGAVISAGLDGGIRAYSSRHGNILWMFDTNREFETVNGVPARGGGMDSAGPVVVDGMLYVNSGVGGFVGPPGNVLLAFGVE